MIKFRFIEKYGIGNTDKYYLGRKKGAIIKIRENLNGYYFSVERTKDNLVYNSLWISHPSPIAPLIGKSKIK